MVLVYMERGQSTGSLNELRVPYIMNKPISSIYLSKTSSLENLIKVAIFETDDWN